ncbi:endothelial PAS domain-containing protein 1 isoform X2 [Mastacembelus armatus]|uniref:endothelial PAS domain-containing protein 1 isoform X2 n=1 Tax=Mastacembelus armatus TaxID=205130 RepID=UPI000E465FD7|nr:endothelial PAS domain-containing protein 1 isoform X2 [Mastacembelus armatus]
MCSKIYLVSCHSSQQSELNWTNPRLFDSQSATYACTHCSKCWAVSGNATKEVTHTVKYGRVAQAGAEQQKCDERCDEQKEKENVKVLEETNMYLRILEGFLMVLSIEGDMVFLSDNVSKYIGLMQTELMGHSIFEFTHPCDHEEIRNNLRVTAGEVWCSAKRDMVIRIKSALTRRARSTNLKSALWKVLHCQGCVKVCGSPSSVPCLLLTCQPLPLSHTLLSTYTFTSQHTMDMRFTYCDQRVTLLLGYSPDELLGRSIYHLCHTLDTNCLTKYHLNLCLKSQSVSGQYRMLVKGGGYVWVESHSAVIPSVRPSRSRRCTNQPLCILCVTYVLSGVEEPLLQLSLDQAIHRYLR